MFAEPGQSWLEGREWRGFGNWGLADQIAALHWVREHVASFGGDPDNVTVFGESAGGMSISALLSVPEARGLFRRAIVESGPPYTQSAEQATARAEDLVAHLGVGPSRGALEQVPAAALVSAAAEVGSRLDGRGQSGLLLMPAVDGGLLPSPPEDAVAAGSAADVDLLIGTTRDETSFFTLGSPRFAQLDEAGLRKWATVLFADADTAGEVVERVRLCRAGRGEPVTPQHLWTAVSTEFLFRWPTIRLADAHRQAAAPGTGTYCYLFTWETPAFGGVLGSCHALEIPFVFGTVHHPGVQPFSGTGDGAFALSAAMRRAWVAFARSGSPGGDPADGSLAGGRHGDGSGRDGSGRDGLRRGDGLGRDGSGRDGLVAASPPGGHPTAEWPVWDPDRRPTMVFGPWPGRQGLLHRVDAPRDEELQALADVDPDRPVSVAPDG